MTTGVNLGSAYAEIELDVSGLQRGINEADRQISGLGNVLSGGLAVAGGAAAAALAGVAAAGAGLAVAMIDVQETAGQVSQTLGDLPTDELQAVTQEALYLERAFGVSVTESVRAADRAVNEFGITSDEAMRLLTEGQELGLDRFGDLQDTINEYAGDFASLGFTMEESLAVLNRGLEAGFRNTDVAADALNEFNIRLRETGRVDALAEIDQDTADIVAAFQSGAITSEQAFAQIGESVRAIEDPIQQSAALVELFGTTVEDAGAGAGLALLTPREEIAALGEEIASSGRDYQTFGQLWADVSSQLQAALIPVSQAFLQIASEAMPHITRGLDAMMAVLVPLIQQFTAFASSLLSAGEPLGTLGEQTTSFGETFSGVFAAVQGVVQAFAGLFQAQMAAVSGFWQEHGTMIMSKLQEIGALLLEVGATVTQLVVAIVQPLVAQMTVFWQQHGDQVMALVGAAMNFILTTITTALDLLLGVLRTTLALIQGDWEGAWTEIQAFSADFVLNLLDLFVSAFDLLKNAVLTALAAIGVDFDAMVAGAQAAAQAFHAVFIAPIMDGINALQNGFRNFVDSIRNFEMPSFDLPDVPGFAQGGIIPAGQLAMVGEQGRELVVPAQDSLVIPNRQTEALMAGSASTYHITINQQPGQSPEMLAEEIFRIARMRSR
jgi:phage-related minor tail protein